MTFVYYKDVARAYEGVHFFGEYHILFLQKLDIDRKALIIIIIKRQ